MRHLNDLKLAHPESLAAPVERPKLGRPSKSSTTTLSDGQTSTEDSLTTKSPDTTSSPLPDPNQLSSAGENKQTNDTPGEAGNSNGRPQRSTRNPNPVYIDGFSWSPKPWSATQAEVDSLNRLISRNCLPADL